jgi:hypothetical protein
MSQFAAECCSIETRACSESYAKHILVEARVAVYDLGGVCRGLYIDRLVIFSRQSRPRHEMQLRYGLDLLRRRVRCCRHVTVTGKQIGRRISVKREVSSNSIRERSEQSVEPGGL